MAAITDQQIDNWINTIAPIPQGHMIIRNPKIATRPAVKAILKSLRDRWQHHIRLQLTQAGGLITEDRYKRAFNNTLMILGDIGTTKQATFEDVVQRIYIIQAHDNNTEHHGDLNFFTRTVDTIVNHTNHPTPLRKFARFFADHTAQHASSIGWTFKVGIEHGMPVNMGHLGFDFADVYKARTDLERIALNQAKRTGLFRASVNRADITNTGNVINTNGVINLNSNSLSRQ